MFDLKNVDTKLLRKQRHALLTAIGDAEAAAGAYIRGDSGTSEIRENHIDMLDGLIGMVKQDTLRIKPKRLLLVRPGKECGPKLPVLWFELGMVNLEQTGS